MAKGKMTVEQTKNVYRDINIFLFYTDIAYREPKKFGSAVTILYHTAITWR